MLDGKLSRAKAQRRQVRKGLVVGSYDAKTHQRADALSGGLGLRRVIPETLLYLDPQPLIPLRDRFGTKSFLCDPGVSAPLRETQCIPELRGEE
jgi:hypothetical protein